MLDNTLTIILAGGVGSRLAPLTEDRAKPAVPFGGKYRIIDFTLANCLHSGLRRVLVLTQYKSHSLQKHLRDGWSIFNPELGEYITPVPPQMRVGERWYTGTADAIYHNLYLLERSEADYVLVLSGDHIYRMDYAAMLEAHRANQADVTVACMQVPVDEANAFGVLRVDADQRIASFQEKPAQPAALPNDPKHALVSMG
ncbi:MAG TPA: sugar phosphate nucleotidyltransferase, partial [Gammaproteobacteria bacterium]|nr:sugar phosphate nucleotidyltransferase [Gammaproteobacteria bacterium]